MENSNSLDLNKEQAFIRHVKSLKPEQIGVNIYEQSYFSHLQLHLAYYVSIYSSLLMEGIARTGKETHNLVLVDYGAGNGMLGVYLKYMGAGRVYVNDINESCLISCRTFANAMNIQIDGYLHGDVDSLKMISDSVDLLLSTDVIEHIYNPDDFFGRLKSYQPTIMAVFTTASNPFNRFKVRQLRKLQHRDEFINSADIWAGENEQFREPFLERRVRILEEEFPNLSFPDTRLIATRSRGMRKDDILRLAANFLQNGRVPEQHVELFNTCDPDTGIWTERILPFFYFQNLAEKYGFTLQLKSGLYNAFGKNRIAKVKKLANYIILLFPRLGKFIAPYIVLSFVPDRTLK